MNITLRNEEEKDYHIVENLTREAFWNLYCPGCTEHYLVHTMRNHPDFIQELDFVAEENGTIVGNIMYTQAWLNNERGEQLEIVSFGPISVLPAYQRKGVGTALIQHSKEIAKGQGRHAIVILGDPHNYCKHGFKSAKDFNIADTRGYYPYGMLALELQEGSIAEHTWIYQESEVYHIDEHEVNEYDKNFVEKEQGYQVSQDIFSIAYRSYLM
ncbi:N-acetyltransferase GCN5 [Candidatus Magnetomorum sp. HK-1]|nr:N-acetyltransferase GCN5 [Candidatus Magnetomorum sp. HK-1]